MTTVTFWTAAARAADNKVRGESRRYRRVKLCCPHCRGHLGLVDSLAGHVFDLQCLLCARNAGQVSALALYRDHGIPWQTLQQAAWNAWTPCWVLVPAGGAS